MQCIEVDAEVECMVTTKLLACSGLTLHGYALRNRLPLDLLVSPEQVNVFYPERNYPLDYLHGLSEPSFAEQSNPGDATVILIWRTTGSRWQ
ncbi:MAG: hypothetical protein OEN52_00650 [Gammaproteobacteria bacterium]|nr:hypothetical protein [Gammaproteobacteria bacterium]